MSSGFVTEAEIQEKRRIRQEQWDKVRQPEEPAEAPEEPVDTRSLYERLKEQKDRKQEEFEESHKLKNLVKTLDDEECQFLDYVEESRHEEEKRKRLEEAKELSEFRHAVSELREQQIEKAIHQELKIVNTKKPKTEDPAQALLLGSKTTSQSQLLAGLVKRKSVSEPTTTTAKQSKPDLDAHAQSTHHNINDGPVIDSLPDKGSLRCIGILPGLACYDDSSDDDDDTLGSSATSAIGTANLQKGEMRDLCGRKVEYIEDKKKSH